VDRIPLSDELFAEDDDVITEDEVEVEEEFAELDFAKDPVTEYIPEEMEIGWGDWELDHEDDEVLLDE
jgi:hypothetical protein